MTEWDQLDNPDLKKLFRKHLLKAGVFLLIFILIILLLAFIFEDSINTFAATLNHRFGFLGLMAVVFFADVIVSPIPPDIALFFVGRSSMHNQWHLLVPLLGLTSTVAGIVGWWLGKKLKHLKIFQKMVNYFGRDYIKDAKRFGFWVVVIGALTPVPFSLTCWFAGIFKMPFFTFLKAASVRIPRFVVYYWALFYSSEIGAFFRSLVDF